MTVIVAKREDGNIILAWDNQTTRGWTKLEAKSTNTNRSKVSKINEEYAIGGAWLVEEITIFHRYCQRITPKGSTENDIYDFMVDFKNHCVATMGKFEFNTQYIIVYKSRIFQINYGYHVQEMNDYATIGSGGDCALVAISMGANAVTAVNKAKQFDIGCGGETYYVMIEDTLMKNEKTKDK